MPVDHDALFAPLNVRGYALRNRIVVPPMVSNRDITAADGIEWYGEFAAGGAGLVIVEATRIHRFGDELTPDNLRPVVDAIHGGGAVAAIQLFWAPPDGRDSPTKVSGDDIATAVDQFGRAAAACAEAGFDGVEPHGAHGFLLNQFFSPLTNQRTDEYGGDMEGRMRLGIEVASRVRAALPDEKLLLYRHTPVQDGGYTMDESLQFARKLVSAGVDILDISPASHPQPAEWAAPFKRQCGVPVIGVGRLGEVRRAVEALSEGRCDLIAIGRAHIADPEWTAKVMAGREADLIECFECNEGCYGNLRSGKPVECVNRR